MSFSRIFRRSGEFLENFRKNSWVVGVYTFSCTSGVPADTSNVVGVSTVAGIPAVAGLPSAVDVIDVLIVSTALQPTVANVLVVSSYCCCWLLAACCCRRNYICKGLFFYGVSSVLAVLLLLSFLLLLAFLLLWAVTLYCSYHPCYCWRHCCSFRHFPTPESDGLRTRGTYLAAVWLADNLATPHPNDK